MHKMYILIRDDLQPSQKAVQGGHALAEFLMRGPKDHKWTNGTLIFLRAKNESFLKKWAQRLEDIKLGYALFRECDLGGEITALAATTDDPKIFKSLRLM